MKVVMSENYSNYYIGVSLMLLKDGKFLMLKRAESCIWAPGKYCLPGGHVENEDIKSAVVREAQEELGVKICSEDLNFVCALNSKGRTVDKYYAIFFFALNKWKGEPYNREPEKHDLIEWLDLESLPENTHRFEITKYVYKNAFKNNGSYFQDL